jgi:transcriptional regulator with XRE-family HTH domain
LNREDPYLFTKRLGKVFADERVSKGLSQNRLSEMAGVARTGIILFERGERVPSIQICKHLADALAVPLSTLVDRAEKKAN